MLQGINQDIKETFRRMEVLQRQLAGGLLSKAPRPPKHATTRSLLQARENRFAAGSGAHDALRGARVAVRAHSDVEVEAATRVQMAVRGWEARAALAARRRMRDELSALCAAEPLLEGRLVRLQAMARGVAVREAARRRQARDEVGRFNAAVEEEVVGFGEGEAGGDGTVAVRMVSPHLSPIASSPMASPREDARRARGEAGGEQGGDGCEGWQLERVAAPASGLVVRGAAQARAREARQRCVDRADECRKQALLLLRQVPAISASAGAVGGDAGSKKDAAREAAFGLLHQAFGGKCVKGLWRVCLGVPSVG